MAPSLAKRPPRPDLSPPRTLVTHSWNSQVADWGRALYNGGDRAGLAQPSDGGQFGNNIGAQAIQDWASAANGGTNLGGFLANSVLWIENTGMAAINELAMMSNYGQPVFTEPLPYVDVPDWSRNWAAPESDFAHNAKMLFGEMATGFIIGEVASGYAAAEGTFAVRSGTAPSSGVQRTNAQLVQDIATRSDAWAVRKGITGTPQHVGIAEHGYAQRVLNRYQDMFGQRGLQTEVSVINGARVPYGTAGSVRLDVLEGSVRTATTIYDYKFGTSGLTPGRINQIRNVGGYPSVPIVPVRP